MKKMKFESPDMTAQNIDRIAALFPQQFQEAFGLSPDCAVHPKE